MIFRQLSLTALLLALTSEALAGVLPEDRSDVLYHLYDGGGVEIDGPSILVRKKAGKSLSFVGNYYVDMISSASIDVVTTAAAAGCAFTATCALAGFVNVLNIRC